MTTSPSSRATSAPMEVRSFPIVRRSATFGTLASRTGSSVSSAAAKAGRAAFFAPEMRTAPSRRRGPEMRNFSTRGLYRSGGWSAKPTERIPASCDPAQHGHAGDARQIRNEILEPPARICADEFDDLVPLAESELAEKERS